MIMRIFRGTFMSAIALLALGCNNLNAGKSEKNLSDKINDLITRNASTLEKVDDGFTIKGTIKNSPQHLIILWEMTPQQLVFIDSARTDASGKFQIQGNTKNMIFAQLQMGPESVIFLAVDNKSKLDVNISLLGKFVDYSIDGNELDDSKKIRKIVDANRSFSEEFNALKLEAEKIPQTQEGMSQAAVINNRYQRLLQQRNDYMMNMAMSEKKGFIPYFMIAFGALESPGYDLFKHAVACAKAADPMSKYTQEIEGKFLNEASLMIGGVAPDIKLNGPDGKPVSLSSLRGKVVLIDFWASWCGPCRRENPNVVKMYQKYKDQGFEIFGVSLDNDANRWKGAIQTDGLTWFHGSDLMGWKSKPAQMYQVHSIPATFLLDKQGKIIAKGLRGAELEAAVANALNN
jgi:thiol-disulfide isomerase/thioredoxin